MAFRWAQLRAPSTKKRTKAAHISTYIQALFSVEEKWTRSLVSAAKLSEL